MKLPQEEKAGIAKYASEHGVLKAVRHFKDKDLKESSVRDWKRLYEKELKKKCSEALSQPPEPGESDGVVVRALPVKK